MKTVEKTLAKDVKDAKDVLDPEVYLEYFLTTKNLLEKLMPTLIDFWMEASAMVFSGHVIDNSHALALLSMCIKTMNFLWRSTVNTSKETTSKWRPVILKYVSVHFPFGGSNYSFRDINVRLSRRSKLKIKAETMTQEMNAQYCEIMCRMAVSLPDMASELQRPLFDHLLNFLEVRVQRVFLFYSRPMMTA